jgi:hypothetical protein
MPAVLTRMQWAAKLEAETDLKTWDALYEGRSKFGGWEGWLCLAYAEYECPGIWQYIAGWCSNLYGWDRDLTIAALKLAVKNGS